MAARRSQAWLMRGLGGFGWLWRRLGWHWPAARILTAAQQQRESGGVGCAVCVCVGGDALRRLVRRVWVVPGGGGGCLAYCMTVCLMGWLRV